MREMHRVAATDGVVAAYVWDYPGEMQMIRRFWDTAVSLDQSASELHQGRRFATCRPDHLESLFGAPGLDGVETLAIDVPTDFVDFDDYWTPFLGGQGVAPSYIASLDEPQRNRLRDAVRERLPTADDGTIRLTARAWAVRGTV